MYPAQAQPLRTISCSASSAARSRRRSPRGRSAPAPHGRKNYLVSRIFITGSTDGLGRAAWGHRLDQAFQDQLMDRLAALTGVALP